MTETPSLVPDPGSRRVDEGARTLNIRIHNPVLYH